MTSGASHSHVTESCTFAHDASTYSSALPELGPLHCQAGLKTGMYYLRTRAAADAIKFTVDQQALAKNKAARAAKLAVKLPPSPVTALKVAPSELS